MGAHNFFGVLLCVPASCLDESNCNDVPRLTRSPKAATTLLCFPYAIKKFVKVFLILKQIPTFVFCIPTYFRIRVLAREFKVELQVFKTLAVTLIDGLYVNLSMYYAFWKNTEVFSREAKKGN